MSKELKYSINQKVSYLGMTGFIVKVENEKKKIYCVDFGLHMAKISEDQLKPV